MGFGPTNLQSAVVEEHDQSVLGLHPLEQQGGCTRGLLPTQKIAALQAGRSPVKPRANLCQKSSSFCLTSMRFCSM